MFLISLNNLLCRHTFLYSSRALHSRNRRYQNLIFITTPCVSYYTPHYDISGFDVVVFNTVTVTLDRFCSVIIQFTYILWYCWYKELSEASYVTKIMRFPRQRLDIEDGRAGKIKLIVILKILSKLQNNFVVSVLSSHTTVIGNINEFRWIPVKREVIKIKCKLFI